MYPRQRKLLMVIWEVGEARMTPSVRQLARFSHMSEMVVYRELYELQSLGWILLLQSPQTSIPWEAKLTAKAREVMPRLRELA